MGEMGLPQCE